MRNRNVNCNFEFSFSPGLNFHILNKELYGFLIEPQGIKKSLHGTRMEFQHIKLQWLGKFAKATWVLLQYKDNKWQLWIADNRMS